MWFRRLEYAGVAPNLRERTGAYLLRSESHDVVHKTQPAEYATLERRSKKRAEPVFGNQLQSTGLALGITGEGPALGPRPLDSISRM
jgi:hypothetical protein